MIVYVTLTVPQVMLVESLGVLIEEGAANMETSPWMLIFPGTLLAVTLFCFNFIGDALDPKDR